MLIYLITFYRLNQKCLIFQYFYQVAILLILIFPEFLLSLSITDYGVSVGCVAGLLTGAVVAADGLEEAGFGVAGLGVVALGAVAGFAVPLVVPDGFVLVPVAGFVAADLGGTVVPAGFVPVVFVAGLVPVAGVVAGRVPVVVGVIAGLATGCVVAGTVVSSIIGTTVGLPIGM